MVLPRIKTEWSLAYRYAMQLTKDTALTSISLASHWHITSVSRVYHECITSISLHYITARYTTGTSLPYLTAISRVYHYYITRVSLVYHWRLSGVSLVYPYWHLSGICYPSLICYTSLRTSDRRGIDESMTRLPLVCHWYITRDIPLTKEIYLS